MEEFKLGRRWKKQHYDDDNEVLLMTPQRPPQCVFRKEASFERDADSRYYPLPCPTKTAEVDNRLSRFFGIISERSGHGFKIQFTSMIGQYTRMAFCHVHCNKHRATETYIDRRRRAKIDSLTSLREVESTCGYIPNTRSNY